MKTYPTRADIAAAKVFEPVSRCRCWTEEYGWLVRCVGGMYLDYEGEANVTVSLHPRQVHALDLDDPETVEALKPQLGDTDVALDAKNLGLTIFF